MSIDALSDVLSAVRLEGAVFYDVHARTPWATSAPPAKELAPFVLPGSEHVIEYHLIVAGTCWGNIDGETPVLLGAGDVVAFPQGDPHVLASQPTQSASDAPANRIRRPVGGQLPVMIVDGGSGEETRLVCAFIGCDARPFNPLLATLPRMIHVRGGGGLLEYLMHAAVTESSERRSGGETVLARLAELLFVEIVRRHIATLPPEQTGWLAGLRDVFVGRTLACLHDRPAHDWSLDELASSVGLSRSALAERFMHFLGIPPIQYLAKWRMQLAASLLAGGTASVAEAARAVGYGSEAAFSRAFKKLVGVPPAAWRDSRRRGAHDPR
jgi:AraC-like DNA-binding protein